MLGRPLRSVLSAFVVGVVFCVPSILATGEPSNVTSATRFNFLHAFTSDTSGSVAATLQAQSAAIQQTQPQLVLITSPSPPATNASVLKDQDHLKTNYSFVGGGRVGFLSAQWDADRDVDLNGSSWTRLTSSDDVSPDVCAVVASEASMNAVLLIDLTARISKFCASWDIVLLGFTSPLSKELAQYLEGITPINGQYAPQTMKEVVALTQQTNNSQLDTAAATNRLFAVFPTTTCVESSVGIAASAEKLDLCVGANCTTCGQPPAPDDAAAAVEPHETSVKRGLIVLLSCGTFLIGCALVFYVFFRKQFFMPSESTKPEKDLTTNLAYVLRM